MGQGCLLMGIIRVILWWRGRGVRMVGGCCEGAGGLDLGCR